MPVCSASQPRKRIMLLNYTAYRNTLATQAVCCCRRRPFFPLLTSALQICVLPPPSIRRYRARIFGLRASSPVPPCRCTQVCGRSRTPIYTS